MAVARVFGRIGGAEVILEHTEGSRWSVPVPLDQDGEYVVEIIAEDEAGNQAYLARMLFVVDSAKLCAHVVQISYYAEVIGSVYKAAVLPATHCTDLIEPALKAVVLQGKYYAELIEPVCELKGGRRCSG